jgi:hypothetical protein
MELAELLGFDELELVAEILADRTGVCAEVLCSTTLPDVILCKELASSIVATTKH